MERRRDPARGVHVGRRAHRHLPPPAWPVPARPGQHGRPVRSLAEPVERGIRHVDRVWVLIKLAQVLKVTAEDLIGQPLSLAPNGGVEYRAIPALRAALTDYEVIPATFGITKGDGPVRDLPSLRRNVDQANRLYQAAHYEEAGLLCARLIGEAQRAARELIAPEPPGCEGLPRAGRSLAVAEEVAGGAVAPSGSHVGAGGGGRSGQGQQPGLVGQRGAWPDRGAGVAAGAARGIDTPSGLIAASGWPVHRPSAWRPPVGCTGPGLLSWNDAGPGRCGGSPPPRPRRPGPSSARGATRPTTVTARRWCGCCARAPAGPSPRRRGGPAGRGPSPRWVGDRPQGPPTTPARPAPGALPGPVSPGRALNLADATGQAVLAAAAAFAGRPPTVRSLEPERRVGSPRPPPGSGWTAGGGCWRHHKTPSYALSGLVVTWPATRACRPTSPPPRASSRSCWRPPTGRS